MYIENSCVLHSLRRSRYKLFPKVNPPIDGENVVGTTYLMSLSRVIRTQFIPKPHAAQIKQKETYAMLSRSMCELVNFLNITK